MRTYGRITQSGSSLDIAQGRWTEVKTDDAGNNDLVYLVTLFQTLLLNINESPFFANAGIPAQQDIMQQVFPDYYVGLIQQQFAAQFASLTIVKQNSSSPVYLVNVTTHRGVKLSVPVPI